MKRLARSVCTIALLLIAQYDHMTLTLAQNSINIIQKDDPQACIAPWQFIPLEASAVGTQTDAYGKTSVALGSYERVSPDGRFILRSFSGGRLGDVSLIELSADGKVVKTYETPLSNEAFPVQGTWRYLVDVNGEHYSFKSVLANQKKAKPLFKAGMTGFYAAAAELPSGKPGHIRIRSLSWPNPSGNAETQGEGALVSRTIEVNTATQRLTHDSGLQHHCANRIKEDGPLYALPMLSVDGQEFAALPQTPIAGQPTMRIFGFGADGKGCEPRATFAFSSGKTIFGFAPQPESVGSLQMPLTSPNTSKNTSNSQQIGGDMAYALDGQVWWYSRFLDQSFNLAPFLEPLKPSEPLEPSALSVLSAPFGFSAAPKRAPSQTEQLQASQSLIASAFPGLTRDGRVIYAANWQTCPAPSPSAPTPACTERPGYVVADPFQSNAYQGFLLQYKGTARRVCITQGEVANARSAFVKFHDLDGKK